MADNKTANAPQEEATTKENTGVVTLTLTKPLDYNGRVYTEIIMDLENYEKFLGIIHDELKEGRALDWVSEDSEYLFTYARYIDTTSTALQRHTVFGGCKPGVKVDIFCVVPTFEDEALRAIAHEAVAHGTGARGLRAICERVLMDVMYELPEIAGEKSVVVRESDILGKTKPEIIEG